MILNIPQVFLRCAFCRCQIRACRCIIIHVHIYVDVSPDLDALYTGPCLKTRASTGGLAQQLMTGMGMQGYVEIRCSQRAIAGCQDIQYKV